MKTILLIFIFLSPVLAFAQSGDSVFTVKRQSPIRLLPETDILYKDFSKNFKVIKLSTLKIDSVVFSSGMAKLKDSVLILKPNRSKTALLKIYAHTGTNSSRLTFIKSYQVLNNGVLQANLNGVENDSAIQRMRVAGIGRLYAPSNPDPVLKTSHSYPIISFNMWASARGIDFSFKGEGATLNPGMRNFIDRMPAGGFLQFDNIRYLGVTGDTLTAARLRVYLLSDDVVKF